MVFAHWCDRSVHHLSKVHKSFRTFVNFDISKYCVLQMALGLLSPSLLLLLWPLSCIFKSSQKRKDHSLNKFSGLRPARQDTKCACSPTPASKSSPQGSTTCACLGVPGNCSRASQEASDTAPRGQAPPRGVQEGPKTANVRFL